MQKLRGSIRDANSLESTITALQIASLKRVSGGTKIVLLDRYGASARAVAKELSRKGFGQVYTIAGGCAFPAPACPSCPLNEIM